MIRLQFSTQKSWVSELIRWRTWCDYSHVDMILPDGRLLGSTTLVVPGGNKGVDIRPANYANFTRKLVVGIKGNYDDHAVYVAAQSQVGKPYDFSSIVNMGLHRDWKENDSWFCSELVAWSFEQAGFPLLSPNEPVSHVSPRDLLLSPYVVTL